MPYEDARESLADRLDRRTDVDERVLEAIASVPRHEFVPEDRVSDAYADRPLPIGHDQTISAPHMVAEMVDCIDVEAGDRVLEIGTGSGYHAAVVAEIVGPGNVYSVEVIEELGETARERLDRLGYDVHVRIGDGRNGYPEGAPYDAAYLTCAPEESVPDPVVEQTREGGVVVAPVGRLLAQDLVKLAVTDAGVEREHVADVQFVRMQDPDEAP